MSKITVKKITAAEKKEMGINSWAEWGCGKSTFDWEYSNEERCYFLEGQAIITDKKTNEKTKINKNDFVIFPKGLKCVWEVIKPVKKKFNFF